jgi:hypothetical protein
MATGHFKYLCRSWGENGVFDGNLLGPVLELRPGQKFSVTISNQLRQEGIYKNIGPAAPKPENWLRIIDEVNGPNAYPHKQDPLGLPFANTCKPATPMDMFYIDESTR